MSAEFWKDLANTLTRENAAEKLADVVCPRCQLQGDYNFFDELANNAVGISCGGCGKHPFRELGIQWLRGTKHRRSNDINAVAAECGDYCYVCGLTFAELKLLGIATAVHHTRPFAKHGEQFKKIPVCSECHEFANALQRAHRRALARP